LQPNFSRMLRRALRAHESGELAQAERLYNALLREDPDKFDVLHGLGLLHYQRGRLNTALTLVQSALRRDSGRADGFASLGLVFHSMRRFKEALVGYDAGLRIEPANAELLNRRGVALLELNCPAEALESFECILAAEPDRLDALGNYGNALIKLNRPAAALAAYDRALALAPQNAQLLTNRAVALRRLDRPHEALMSASAALIARPDFAQAKFVEAVTRLTLGDFSAGWRGYESRWGVGALASQRRNFTAPLWLGREPLRGKTILLHAEQGFGDTLQFVRYAPLLAERGAKEIVLEVQPELKRLLQPMSGVSAVVACGEPLPHFDFYCPLLSLPLALATELETIPGYVPYVFPADDDVAAWRECLTRRRRLIGLAWSGERSHDNDRNRSIPLETLLPLLDLPDLSFVSLQHEVREEDRSILQDHSHVLHVTEPFRDFADTAAAVWHTDLVISVDSAVAHLAGAMGKPVFLMLPFAADFRWLRERQDSPWYPTARLYRQAEFGNWDGVIGALRQQLTRASFLLPPRRLSA
jgi:tetratricopeptide (TPR) repeat protein